MPDFNRAEVIDPVIETQILKTLDQIEQDHDVKILHAAESGSRAWGFHSPNSDYDVRFMYVHKKDWYLSIYPGRDVIELPINETYDVSGWDLKKTLHLAMKSNAVVMEWLQSPIQYKSNPDFVNEMIAFCQQSFDRKALMYHYLNLGIRDIDKTWRTSNETQIKKYFYILRPAIALRWLECNADGFEALPMNVQALMEQSDVPEAVKSSINELIEQKRTKQEKAMTEKIERLDEFALQQYEQTREQLEKMPKSPAKQINAADQFFQKWLI